MITRIKAHNFKCFKDVDVELKPLTVLCGLNGSGKSTFIQVITALKACALNWADGMSSLNLQSADNDIGTAHDMYYQFNGTDDLIISIGVGIDGPDGPSATLSFPYVEEDAGLDRLELVGNADSVDEERKIAAELKKVRRLSANRLGPQGEYRNSESAVRNRDMGLDGAFAAAYLLARGSQGVDASLCRQNSSVRAVSNSLSDQVSAWMEVVSPYASVQVERGSTDEKVKLSYSFATKTKKVELRPANVGAGLSIVLPVLVMLLSSEPGDCLIIENPESDLHPRGQAELANLIARAVRRGVQVIVETHSDHIINGIRVAVKQGAVDSEAVRILFFRRDNAKVLMNAQGDDSGLVEQYSYVTLIDMDANGVLSKPCRDLLDMWGIQLDYLIGLSESPSGGEGNTEGGG